jgi:Ca2+-binding RTX toxin-like protein
MTTITVSGPTSVREGDGSFQLSLVLANVGVLSGTYSYGFAAGSSTATNGADVSVPSGSGSFSVAQAPAGDYVIDLGAISIVDDALSEGAETVAITLSVPGHTFANGSSTYVHVVTLRDNDPINGTADNDVLTGGADNEVLNGKDGDDELWGLGGDDHLGGGNGNDHLNGGDGDDWLSGGTGNDVIDGGDGVDTVDYTANPLTIEVSLANQGDVATADTAAGWSGLDYLLNIENLFGTNYGDKLTGSDGANVLGGGGGNDQLIGLGGDDVLGGGFGNDTLWGGDGEDQLWGSWDSDTLHDGGETQNRDFLYGGRDGDTYYVTSSFSGPLDVVYEGWDEIQHRGDASDFDVIHSEGEFFWDYYGVGERLIIDRAEGSQMVGGTNNQTIWGNVGNDVILAYGGSNIIDAGAGTDVIGLGLYGLDESADGANTVVMKAGSGIDYVYEFESGVDKVDLTSFNFGITGQQVLDQAVNVDLAGTADDHVYFYLTGAGGVNNFIVFMGLQSNQLQASDFIT